MNPEILPETANFLDREYGLFIGGGRTLAPERAETNQSQVRLCGTELLRARFFNRG